MAHLNILVTGATGYVIGTVLTELWEDGASQLFHSGRDPMNLSIILNCVVRKPEAAEALKTAYPPTTLRLGDASVSLSLTTVIGTLDSTDLLRDLATKSDIVLQSADCDHVEGAHALLQGIAQAPTSPNRPTPGGAGNTIDPEIPKGSLTRIIVSDSLAESNSQPPLKLPRERMHAALEQSLAEYAHENDIHFIELSPSTILGQGTSRIGKKETFPALWYEAMIKHGGAFVISPGQNSWSVSSMRDVARGMIFTLGELIDGGAKAKVPCRLEFGLRGYYYIESMELDAMERATHIAKRLHGSGKFKTDHVEKLSEDEVKERYGDWITMIVGINMRCRADRLKKLGWVPKDLDLGAMVDEGNGERV